MEQLTKESVETDDYVMLNRIADKSEVAIQGMKNNEAILSQEMINILEGYSKIGLKLEQMGEEKKLEDEIIESAEVKEEESNNDKEDDVEKMLEEEIQKSAEIEIENVAEKEIIEENKIEATIEVEDAIHTDYLFAQTTEAIKSF